MPTVTSLNSHASLLRSMYRNILRSLANIRSLVPVIDPKAADGAPPSEVAKALRNPELYGTLLRSELRYYVDEEFRTKYSKFNAKSVFLKLQVGALLIATLKQVHAQPLDPLSWNKLINILTKHRQSQHQKEFWKADYAKHKTEIDNQREREVDHLTLKRIQSYLSRPKNESDPKYSDLSPSKQYKELKAMVSESKANANCVVRNYLKYLQLNGRIPIPYKLPYVSDTLTKYSTHIPKPLELLPNSTKSFVLDEAYDMEYIASIIKPEIEFLINMNHFMLPWENRIVNEGPYKVKIRNTTAGVMTANFLRAPNYKPPEMKELALDIKKLMRLIRKQFIWNLDLDPAAAASERSYGEGYGVRGSRGFSAEEIMYPRKYYERLVDEEARWEAQMNIEKMRSMHDEVQLTSGELQKLLMNEDKLNFDSWRKPLDESTQRINSDIQALYDKYKVTKDSPIWAKQERLQDKMNGLFARSAKRYCALLDKLEEKRFFLHSDLFMNDTVSDNYEAMKKRDDVKEKSRRNGLSEVERAGLGKSLGDYLTEFKSGSFKMGYNFAKRFKF